MASNDEKTVRRALASKLGEAAAESEARRWAQEYRKLPGLGILRFIQRLGEEYGISDQDRRRLRLQLFGELHSDERKPSAPATGSRGPASGSGSAGSEREPAAIVTETLVGTLAGYVRSDRWADFHTALIEHLQESPKIDGATVSHLSKWRGNTVPRLGGPEAALAEIAHAAYLAVCDASGPAVADRCLADAVRVCEELAEARSFSPRRLL